MWQIYSIGDSSWLEQVLISVAMVFSTDTFSAMIQLGLLLGVISVLLQGIMAGGQKIEIQHVLLSIILFQGFFVPKATVQIEDVYTGSVRVVANVPLGVAFLGTTFSLIGYKTTELFEVAYDPLMPRLTDGSGFGDSLSLLTTLRRDIAIAPVWASMNQGAGAGNIDLHKSWYNYIKDCTYTKVSQGYISPTDVLSDEFRTALKFDATISNAEVFLDPAATSGQVLTCDVAFDTLQAVTEAAIDSAAVTSSLNAIMGINGATSPKDSKAKTNDVIQMLYGGGMTASTLIQLGLLRPILDDAAAGKYKDYMDTAAATMVNEAVSRRNTQWAAEHSMFQSIIRPMVSFFEGFVYAITPIMAFVIMLGKQGFGMAIKYTALLIWIQLWYPILSIVNLFIGVITQTRIAEFATSPAYIQESFYALDSGADIASNWIATGGLMAASVSALSLMIIYGSAVTATHLADRMKGDFINEDYMTPKSASTESVAKLNTALDKSAASQHNQASLEPLNTSISSSVNAGATQGSINTTVDSSMSSLRSTLRESGGMSQTFGLSNDELASVSRTNEARAVNQTQQAKALTAAAEQRFGVDLSSNEAFHGYVAASASMSAGADIDVGRFLAGAEKILAKTSPNARRSAAESNQVGDQTQSLDLNSPSASATGAPAANSPAGDRPAASLSAGITGTISGIASQSTQTAKGTNTTDTTSSSDSVRFDASSVASATKAVAAGLTSSNRDTASTNTSYSKLYDVAADTQDAITVQKQLAENSSSGVGVVATQKVDLAQATEEAAARPAVAGALGAQYSQALRDPDQSRANQIKRAHDNFLDYANKNQVFGAEDKSGKAEIGAQLYALTSSNSGAENLIGVVAAYTNGGSTLFGGASTTTYGESDRNSGVGQNDYGASSRPAGQEIDQLRAQTSDRTSTLSSPASANNDNQAEVNAQNAQNTSQVSAQGEEQLQRQHAQAYSRLRHSVNTKEDNDSASSTPIMAAIYGAANGTMSEVESGAEIAATLHSAFTEGHQETRQRLYTDLSSMTPEQVEAFEKNYRAYLQSEHGDGLSATLTDADNRLGGVVMGMLTDTKPEGMDAATYGQAVKDIETASLRHGYESAVQAYQEYTADNFEEKLQQQRLNGWSGGLDVIAAMGATDNPDQALKPITSGLKLITNNEVKDSSEYKEAAAQYKLQHAPSNVQIESNEDGSYTAYRTTVGEDGQSKLAMDGAGNPIPAYTFSENENGKPINVVLSDKQEEKYTNIALDAALDAGESGNYSDQYRQDIQATEREYQASKAGYKL